MGAHQTYMTHLAVGIGYKEGERDGKMKIVFTASADTLYLTPYQARNLALDLLIQANRMEKKETWDALKQTPETTYGTEEN